MIRKKVKCTDGKYWNVEKVFAILLQDGIFRSIIKSFISDEEYDSHKFVNELNERVGQIGWENRE